MLRGKLLAGLCCLVLWAGEVLAAGVDHVVVYKAERTMQLLAKGKVVKTYAIGLGDDPFGHKQQEGDERTPEGNYVIDYRNPQSGYHLSLHISYPNARDKANAKKAGVDPGGMIMIHGLPNGYGWAKHFFAGRDWTDGCIAVNNEEIEEIGQLVANGTPITIHP
ncbi:L,D-transpeptidase family protein [Thiosocius teredinicola]|uniref:L,D-transpeptidase family protein n=1 Tax=Thiosocius teredinicola TaxID=1973002 RepID=UPI000990ABDB